MADWVDGHAIETPERKSKFVEPLAITWIRAAL